MLIITCFIIIILFFLINVLSLWLEWTPRLGDNIHIVWAIFGFISLAMVALLVFKVAHADYSLSGKTIIDHDKREIRHTEPHDFSSEYGTVKTTATVLENECNRCLRDNNPSSCLIKCDQVIMQY